MPGVGEIERRRLEQRLNSPDCLPPCAYRRNHKIYELVAYMNCLIGCRISGNSEGEAVFRERSLGFMDDHPPDDDEVAYYAVSREYIEK